MSSRKNRRSEEQARRAKIQKLLQVSNISNSDYSLPLVAQYSFLPVTQEMYALKVFVVVLFKGFLNRNTQKSLCITLFSSSH